MKPIATCRESLTGILSYPLHSSILYSLIAYAFVMSLASDFAYGVITFFLYLMVFRYGYAILGSTARGLTKHKGMTDVELKQNIRVPLQQMVVFALIIAIAVYFQQTSPITSVLFLLGVSAVLPASIITLAITRDCTLALNPFVLIEFIKTIGWSYFGLHIISSAWTIIATAFISAIMSMGELQDSAPLLTLLVEMLLHFVLIYLFVATTYLYGYVVHQHHEALGVEQFTPFVVQSADNETNQAEQD